MNGVIGDQKHIKFLTGYLSLQAAAIIIWIPI